MTHFPELPWQDINTLTPEPGGDEVFVWNGERLTPQPTHHLPLSPPRS